MHRGRSSRSRQPVEIRDGALRSFFYGRFKMNKFERYEAMKKSWTLRHPDATQHEYELAMISIARECGI